MNRNYTRAQVLDLILALRRWREMKKKLQKKRRKSQRKTTSHKMKRILFQLMRKNPMMKRSLQKLKTFSYPKMEILCGPPFLHVTDDVCWVQRRRGAPEGQQGMQCPALIA